MDLFKGALSGLIGGLVASWVMTQFQTHVPPDAIERLLGEPDSTDDAHDRRVADEPERSRAHENGEPEDLPATEQAAEVIAESVFRHEFDDDDHRVAAGQLVHYAFGSAAGAAYGALSEVAPVLGNGAGAPFGAAFWVLADELGVPAAGLSDPPWEYPASTHVYGLASHIVYGVVLEATRRAVRAVL